MERMGPGADHGERMKNRKRLRFAGICLGLVGLAAVSIAQEDDHFTVDPGIARRADVLILARCSVCHAPDLIYQQRLSRDRWTATVDKMVQWGAEVSADEADLLVQYLTARYHPGAPDQLPPLDSDLGKSEPLMHEPAIDGPITGVAARGSASYAHNCQACHGEGATGGMGPKLARNAVLKNEGAFWDTVLHGRGPMPAWDGALSDQEIADVHAWLLSLSAEF
jgi:mono/diheme cytochrome c family protein